MEVVNYRCLLSTAACITSLIVLQRVASCTAQTRCCLFIISVVYTLPSSIVYCHAKSLSGLKHVYNYANAINLVYPVCITILHGKLTMNFCICRANGGYLGKVNHQLREQRLYPSTTEIVQAAGFQPSHCHPNNQYEYHHRDLKYTHEPLW